MHNTKVKYQTEMFNYLLRSNFLSISLIYSPDLILIYELREEIFHPKVEIYSYSYTGEGNEDSPLTAACTQCTVDHQVLFRLKDGFYFDCCTIISDMENITYINLCINV